MSVAEACEAAVERSDNTCANPVGLARVGGPAALEPRVLAFDGRRGYVLDHNEPEGLTGRAGD